MITHNEKRGFMKSIRIFLYVLFLLLTSVTLAESAKLRMEIQAEPVVSSNRISLGDVAKITGGSPKEIKQMKGIHLTNLSSRDNSKTLSRNMVVAVLKKNRVDVEEIDFVSPELVAISRSLMTVSSQDLEGMARNYLEEILRERWDSVSITNLKYEGKDLLLPEGNVKVDFLPLNRSRMTGSLFIYANVFVDGKLVKKIKVRAFVKVSRIFAVAAKNIKKGDILTGQDFEMEEKFVERENMNFLTEPEEIIGKRAKQMIRAKSVLKENMLDIPPLVNKNARVRIVLESKYLKITAVGIAQERGKKGSYIKVMNIDSKKIIMAKVIGENLVKMDF